MELHVIHVDCFVCVGGASLYDYQTNWHSCAKTYSNALITGAEMLIGCQFNLPHYQIFAFFVV